MRVDERLERFWHDFVLSIPFAEELSGSVVTCYPQIPLFHFNHAATIDVKDKEAKCVLTRITKFFRSRGYPYVCFRTSPLTRPKTFTSLLRKNGFEKKLEESVMVFNEKQLRNKLTPEVKIKEITEIDIDVYTELILTNFEMRLEWKKGIDTLALTWMQQGWKCYLAYVGKRPVGTCLLSSLNGIGGIFNVGTLKEYRRRGIGAAMTLRAVIDSIDEGNDLHILETEKGGNAEHLYRKIGFEIVHAISYFVKEIMPKNSVA